MVANLQLVKGQTDQAIATYMQLLEKTPDNFNTLAQLIELLRRAGRLKEVDPIIESASKICKRSNMAGLAFCKGLSHFFQNSPMEALKELNVARQDNTFGQQATVCMVEIYLNPAQEMLVTLIEDQQNNNATSQTTPQNIQVARELIEDLASKGVDTTIFECQAHIATGVGESISLAEKQLKTLLGKNKEYVPALVAYALCKFMKKQNSQGIDALRKVSAADF